VARSVTASKKSKRIGLDRLIINALFFRQYRPGITEMEFLRDDYDWALRKVKEENPQRFKAAEVAARNLADAEGDDDGPDEAVSIEKHKNIGAVIYDYRFRRLLPPEIRATENPSRNLHWRIKLAGKGKYKFALGPSPFIVPSRAAKQVDVFEATPEIIAQYAFDDEQALLAKVRYNRLIDTFLGITAHSLQNHLRTSVEDIGQIEIDELYVGHDGEGNRYVVPVQAKGKKDKLSIVQTEQDHAFCVANQKFAKSRIRCVSAQFLDDGRIHLFELQVVKDEAKIVKENRYNLIAAETSSRAKTSRLERANEPRRARSQNR
jgi:hypothetical protein